ncbi:MAG: hypothetical protein CFK52_11315 [Chloracidobacterium sp. CP2_5A]|nr:MAG: hypothetical protein CFK52_11315 [Chloracidobacterium sp. CP2_5A]
MYRKPRFLEKLHLIREELAEACGYDAERLTDLLRREDSSALSPLDEPPLQHSLPIGAPFQSSQ